MSLLTTLSNIEPRIRSVDTSQWEENEDSLLDMASEIEGMSPLHPDYGRLAGRVVAHYLHSTLPSRFTERMKNINALPSTDSSTSRRLSSKFLAFLDEHGAELDRAMEYERDYNYNYVGWRTAIKVYLASHNEIILETIQDFHMRVAIQHATGLTGRDSKDRLTWCVREYHDLCRRMKIYATPICRNSGYESPQLSSCFLVHVPDSIDGIYTSLGDCAKIHARMGGCAINMSNVRGMGSRVRSTGGRSSGLISYARAFDHTSSIIESGGRRSGSNALWLEPHHIDILDVLTSRSLASTKSNEMRTLFQGLFLSDEFMRRVEGGGKWTLLDPSIYPCLDRLYGSEFERQYKEYEEIAHRELGDKGRVIQHEASGIELISVSGNCAMLNAIDLWNVIKTEISDASIPYLVAKDSVNRANQHSNLGTVRMSNLCTEIFEYSDENMTAVCTLGNLILPSYVRVGVSGKAQVDYLELHSAAKRMCIGLNSVIDSQSLPTERASLSSRLTRAIGIGIQGLANVLIKLNVPFDSEEGRRVNRRVSEVIYHAALEASCELAEDTQPYPRYRTNGGSYLSHGRFHWEVFGNYPYRSEMTCDWETLRERIEKYGVANSLVTAYAPTSTTSLMEGNEESFQPIVSNVVSRTTLSGDYVVIQPSLCRRLEEEGVWSETTRNAIIRDSGSVQSLPISDEIKRIYRTAYEISSKSVIDMSHDRGYFVDQGQSLNLFVPYRLDFSSFLDTAIFYGWKVGNKNLMYYARQEKTTEALYVNVSGPVEKTETENVGEVESEEPMVCRREPGCTWCE